MPYILLIEPDRILAKIYSKALETNSHRVVVCAGAQPAILMADQEAPNLVILELQLVEHSGIEFLYEFRSYPEWESIPVIIHSFVPAGEFSDSWQLLKDEMGVKAYLYKPRTTIQELLINVDQISSVKK